MHGLDSVKRVLKAGEPERAIEELISIMEINSFGKRVTLVDLYDEAILISGNLKTISKRTSLGLITSENETVERNKITYAILSLIQRMPKLEEHGEIRKGLGTTDRVKAIKSESTFEYDIFLSFSSHDLQQATMLWEVFTGYGFNAFFSTEFFKEKIGSSYQAEIGHALENSKNFVLLWTENSQNSVWVESEYTIFFNEIYVKNKSSRRMFILRPDMYSGVELPIFLRLFQVTSEEKYLINSIINNEETSKVDYLDSNKGGKIRKGRQNEKKREAVLLQKKREEKKKRQSFLSFDFLISSFANQIPSNKTSILVFFALCITTIGAIVSVLEVLEAQREDYYWWNDVWLLIIMILMGSLLALLIYYYRISGSFVMIFSRNNLKTFRFTMLVALIGIIVLVFFISQGSLLRTMNLAIKDSSIQLESAKSFESLGNDALKNQEFDTAIVNYRKANRTDLVALAESEAIMYWNNKAANAKSYEEAIAFLKITVQYGNDPTNDIAGFRSKVAARNAANRLDRKPQPEATFEEPETSTQNCIDKVVIRIPNGRERKALYSVGDRLTVLAKSSSDPISCTEGSWDYDYGLYAKKDNNPTVFEVTALPSNGIAHLRYIVEGKVVGILSIKVGL